MLRLRETTADDVMVPRADIVAMRVDVSFEQAIAQIREEGHSRLPVYREQLDDIVGMVHIKDVFAYVGRPKTFSLEPMLRRPLMIAPQIPVLDLLLQMRQSRMHLALVVDEYGGIDGLVTIEDLVETIVGDISDEHDEVVGPMVTERPDGSLDVNARLPVEEFEQRLGPVLTEEERESDIDTVGRPRVHARGPRPGAGRGRQSFVRIRVPRARRRSAPHPARARPPAAADAVRTGRRRSRRLTPQATDTAQPRPNPYSAAGFSRRMRSRVGASGIQDAITAGSGSACGQLLPRTQRSGARLIIRRTAAASAGPGNASASDV